LSRFRDWVAPLRSRLKLAGFGAYAPLNTADQAGTVVVLGTIAIPLLLAFAAEYTDLKSLLSG
jgi:hypothetical protein